MFFFVLNREGDVDHRQQTKDQGLNGHDQTTEQVKHDRDRQQPEPHGREQADEDGEDHVVGGHVGHESNRERDGAHDVADQLDDEHQRVDEPRDPPRHLRAEEVSSSRHGFRLVHRVP